MKTIKIKELLSSLFILLITILLCTIPMKLSPHWNGTLDILMNQNEILSTNQYEVLADAFLEGHLYVDYHDMDERLLNMENPYNTEERRILGIRYHWDHAFYNGKYYVYFGVAPTIFTFIPYKLITGKSLVSYKATMLYTSIFIIGLFALLYQIRKYFYPKTNHTIYLLLSSSLSIISVWVNTCCPAQYCTAMSAGQACAIWSIFFYLKAVYGNHSYNKSILYATIGAFLGALIFACRPPIGLVNILAIPLLITFLKKHSFNKKIFIVIIPYIIIGISLMIYNYIRFDNIFEFGQSYQLTVTDQHNYINIFSRINIINILINVLVSFISSGGISKQFPFITISGSFINFPILIIPYLLFISKNFRQILKNKNIYHLYIFLMVIPFIIIIFDTLTSPYIINRYRLDVHFILSILSFIGIANYFSQTKNYRNKIFDTIIIILSIFAIITGILLFFVPDDFNYIQYHPEINQKINNFLKL